ncbi:MAG: hypothetical protein Q9225_007459 [Loekoesia sp. 1 TL-2023]
MLRYLDQRAQVNPRRDSIVSIMDNFTIEGPNGTHICYVSQVEGPSVAQILDYLGEIAGSRRLHGPLARKLAGQLANAVFFMHSLGVVHGDITPRNVLLRLANIDEWSLDDVSRQLDRPVKDEAFKRSGEKPDMSAPEYLVQPTSFSSVTSRYVSEEILLIDLGEAFLESSAPSKGVGTPVSYCSPELTLEAKASSWSDVWALSCTMFKMRSGFPLFESFIGSASQVLQEMVEILGTPPNPWWPSLKQHDVNVGQNETSETCSGALLSERISEIGTNDDIPSRNGTETPMSKLIEAPGTEMAADEVNALTGLLQRTLHYTPEACLPVGLTIKHPWFADTF